MQTPVVYPYQRALDEFRREGREGPLLKRMSELISLLDLTTTLSSSLTGEEILNAALLIVLGELQVARGALLVRDADGRFRTRAARGLPRDAPTAVSLDPPPADAPLRAATAPGSTARVLAALGVDVLCPIVKRQKTIALLVLGPRAEGRAYGAEEDGFLRSVAACAATPIENGLIYDELRQVNHKLSIKVFQLRNLFDLSRELTSSFDEEAIKSLVATTVMGQLMVSRSALYLREDESLVLAHERGIRGEEGPFLVPIAAAGCALESLRDTSPVPELPAGALRDRLLRTRMSVVVPLAVGGRVQGLLAIGERASGAPFSEEDCDFARTLGRQALAALENVRLLRVQVEKQRQDREMQIAREIQQSLFPSGRPRVAGFDLAAESQSCYQVGGDYYDFIPLSGGRLALAVADVSGKGSPASILMASVHASLRALAGSAPPAVLAGRLNRFLYESTQPNKYVTFFYAELDPSARRLDYVNCGHVPPFRLGRRGREQRISVGGPVLGLLDEAEFKADALDLLPGDVLAVVTDGATEAMSPEGVELGDERVATALREAAAESASEILRRLVARVASWTGPAGCSDDLTALIIKAL
jgi:sigma-B regulation protein RsbU (phosphoserine phosphatase)